MAQATYDDANLVLRLYELRREPKMRQARDWFATTYNATTLEELDKLCPMGSEQNAYARMVASYWEMAASFVTSGVLNPELFFESGGELLFVWAKLAPLAPAIRERYKNPQAYSNIEKVANEMIAWASKRAPGFYENFQQMVRSVAASRKE
jgi:hypothetical protein